MRTGSEREQEQNGNWLEPFSRWLQFQQRLLFCGTLFPFSPRSRGNSCSRSAFPVLSPFPFSSRSRSEPVLGARSHPVPVLGPVLGARSQPVPVLAPFPFSPRSGELVPLFPFSARPVPVLTCSSPCAASLSSSATALSQFLLQACSSSPAAAGQQ